MACQVPADLLAAVAKRRSLEGRWKVPRKRNIHPTLTRVRSIIGHRCSGAGLGRARPGRARPRARPGRAGLGRGPRAAGRGPRAAGWAAGRATGPGWAGVPHPIFPHPPIWPSSIISQQVQAHILRFRAWFPSLDCRRVRLDIDIMTQRPHKQREDDSHLALAG